MLRTNKEEVRRTPPSFQLLLPAACCVSDTPSTGFYSQPSAGYHDGVNFSPIALAIKGIITDKLSLCSGIQFVQLLPCNIKRFLENQRLTTGCNRPSIPIRPISEETVRHVVFCAAAKCYGRLSRWSVAFLLPVLAMSTGGCRVVASIGSKNRRRALGNNWISS